MSWQDVVFSIGGLAFIFTLLPTLKDKQSYVPWATSVATSTVLFIFGLAFTSLHMWLSAITEFATAVLWYLVAVYRSQKPFSYPSEGGWTYQQDRSIVWYGPLQENGYRDVEVWRDGEPHMRLTAGQQAYLKKVNRG